MRLAPLTLFLVASCGTTLMKEDIRRQSDGWTVTFHQLDDGPNAYGEGNYDVKPASGEHFLWVILSVRNDGSTERQFPFDSCGLDLGEDASLPLYVGLNFGRMASVTKTPKLAAGEEITRKLCYGYPDGHAPKRLVCFGNEIPLRTK
jgi:hypothetical protein